MNFENSEMLVEILLPVVDFLRRLLKKLNQCCGSEIQCLFDPRIRSGKNIPDHISESLETIFWVKNTEIL
jgi:hypothetical protein